MARWKAPMELPRRNSMILYLSMAVFVVLLGIAQVGSPGSQEGWYARSALAKVWWPVEGSDLDSDSKEVILRDDGEKWTPEVPAVAKPSVEEKEEQQAQPSVEEKEQALPSVQEVEQALPSVQEVEQAQPSVEEKEEQQAQPSVQEKEQAQEEVKEPAATEKEEEEEKPGNKGEEPIKEENNTDDRQSPSVEGASVADEDDQNDETRRNNHLSDEEKKKYALTPDLVKQVVMKGRQEGEKGSPVVVTWANYHYLDFVLNWVFHLNKTGCQSYLVGAMDDALLEELVERNIPAFGMSSGLTLDDFGWGTSTFNKMGREKINLIYAFTKWEFDVIITDVDTVWMKDPIPYMERYPDADILVSSDHLKPSVEDDGLENFAQAASAANIGIMFFRPKAVSLAEEWVNVLEKDPTIWDQNAFNDLFRKGWEPSTREDRLFPAYNRKLLLGILPVSIFCSGHTFFVQNLPKKLGLEPYVAHATFQYSGTPGKRNRFREKDLWHDPDSYFQSDNGFISAQYKVSDRLLDAVKKGERKFDMNSTMPHFNLVNDQILVIRTLFALGTTLNRSIVMPKLFCGMDRWWAPHDGNIPGAPLDLPYQCPLDHVINLEQLQDDNTKPEQHGPAVEWKEYSFLEKERASYLQEKKLTVITCNEKSDMCDGGDKEAHLIEGKVVKLKAKRTDVQIRTALASIMHKFDLIVFENPLKLWKGFEKQEDMSKFVSRYTKIADLWCCIQGHPGHIWYDLFWDTIPHTDKFGRYIDKEWQPQLGP